MATMTIEKGVVFYLRRDPPFAFIRSDEGSSYGTNNPDCVAKLYEHKQTHPVTRVQFQALRVDDGKLALGVSILTKKKMYSKKKKEVDADEIGTKMEDLVVEGQDTPKTGENDDRQENNGHAVTDNGNRRQAEERFHQLLAEWWCVPELWHKTEFPFPCEGFLIASKDKNNNADTICVFSPRLGYIKLKDAPSPQGLPFARFIVTATGQSQAWEFDDLPNTLISAEEKDGRLKATGFAMMAFAKSDTDSDTWNAWNEQLGLLRFAKGSANGPEFEDWEPTGQIIKFEASSTDNGQNWFVDRCEILDFLESLQCDIFPKNAYFADDLTYKKHHELPDGVVVIEFHSDIIGGAVYARLDHIRKVRAGKGAQYGAVIVPLWPGGYHQRQMVALIVAPKPTWECHLLYRELVCAIDKWVVPPPQ